jgi:alpha-L-rhamnosidase
MGRAKRSPFAAGRCDEPAYRFHADWISRPRGTYPAGFASLILPRGADDDKNRHVLYRRTFELAGPTERAIARVSADGRYELFINGELVGRGPARHSPRIGSYDVYDLAALLQSGTNLVAIHARSYGRAMSWYQMPRREHRLFGSGGVLCELEIVLYDGSEVVVRSDRSWRVATPDAYRRDTPGGAVGFVEIFDARRWPARFSHPDFDDSGWSCAELIVASGINRGPDQRPYPAMEARGIPALAEWVQQPARLVVAGSIRQQIDAGEIVDAGELVSAARDETFAANPSAGVALGAAEACLVDGNAATVIRTTPGYAASLVFDFGRICSGYPFFEIADAPAGACLDFAYSERLRDGNRCEVTAAVAILSQNVHRVTLRSGFQRYDKSEWVGFRYLQITVRGAESAPVRLRRVGLVATGYPVEPRGRFECSDARLTRIWQLGADTLRLCMHDGFEDCPSREQRQWVGDAYVQALILFTAFGDARLARRLVRLIAQGQHTDGMLPMAAPGDLADEGGEHIVDYPCYWMAAIDAIARYAGDEGLSAELLPAVARCIAWYERFAAPSGLIDSPPGWIFLDWADLDRRGECTALNGLYVMALEAAARIADRAAAPAWAARWRAIAHRVRTSATDQLWDEARGAYVDARIGGRLSRRISQHGNAVAIAYGLAPRERWQRIIETITHPKRLQLTPTGMAVGDPATAQHFDEERDVVLAQPFFQHHVHRAFVAAGRTDLLLASIRDRWGTMLDAGATALWELWHAGASQCHAWSGTPTFDLTAAVLGIHPVADNFSRARIVPSLGDLEWASATIPTPCGDLSVACRRDPTALGGIRLEVKAPSGVDVEMPAGLASSRLP